MTLISRRRLAAAALAVAAVAAPAAAGTSSGAAEGAARPGAGARAVAIAADPATGGYWILKSAGGVAAFGAPWRGSLAGRLKRGTTATAIAAGAHGGYLVLTSDGAVHGFGARLHGSDAGRLRRGVLAIGLATDRATGGYWILTSAGRVDGFGAPEHGSPAGHIPAGAAADAIAAGRPGGYLVLSAAGGPLPGHLAGGPWNVLPTRRKVVALTFDIGPVNGVPKTLATLRRDHVPATFFMTGRRAAGDQRAARAIAAAGQLIGNHSNNHPDFTTISDARIGQEIRAAQARIESVTGRVSWPWFRFPYGAHDRRTLAAVNALGYAVVGWTVDSLGWKGRSGGITVREVVARVLAARRPGEIVLMHGGSDSGDGSTLDADALPTVIRRLRGDGYSFVTMDFLDRFGARVRPADGLVRSFGTPGHGSDAGRLAPGVTAVGLASDPVTGGYWILTSTGAVDAFHAPSRGSASGPRPDGTTVVAITAGRPGGYLILSSDGAVRAFGTPYFGSGAGLP